MHEIMRIKDQLEKAFYGGAWHGPSVWESLDGLSLEKAARKPAANVHSIWEIALHIDTWHNAVRRRLLGDPADISDEEDWPQIKLISDIGWNKDMLKLRESMDALIDAVEKYDESNLDKNAAGQSYSNYFMLHGLAQHDIYHAGQIMLLKKYFK